MTKVDKGRIGTETGAGLAPLAPRDAHGGCGRRGSGRFMEGTVHQQRGGGDADLAPADVAALRDQGDDRRASKRNTKRRFSPTFFDGNSEAFNKMKVGGTKDFDLVQADGFWPRLYFRQGLTQAVDYGKIPNMSGVFPDFLPPNFPLLADEAGATKVAAPNCWGGYGITVNTAQVAAEDIGSIGLLLNEKYAGQSRHQLALRGEHRADGHPRGDQSRHHRRRAARRQAVQSLQPDRRRAGGDQEAADRAEEAADDPLSGLRRARPPDARRRGLGGAGILRDLPAPHRAPEGRQDRLRRSACAEAEGGRPRLGRHLDDQRRMRIPSASSWPTTGSNELPAARRIMSAWSGRPAMAARSTCATC